MQAGDVITLARQGLSDIAKTRWSDARLLALLNDGLNILKTDTVLLIERLYVELIEGLEEYDLSERATKIMRVEYKGQALTQTSHENLDQLSSTWKAQTSANLQNFITDKYRPGRFRLFPMPVNVNATLVEYTGLLGIMTDISYTDYQLEVAGTEGEIGVPGAPGWIYVHFCKNIEDVTSLNTEIDIDSFCKTALSHYIVARALRDNQDTQNRQLASEEMSMFEAVVDKFSIARSKIYSSGALKSSYRGGIN